MDGCLAPSDQRLVWVFIRGGARNDASVSGGFYVTLSNWGGGGTQCVLGVLC